MNTMERSTVKEKVKHPLQKKRRRVLIALPILMVVMGLFSLMIGQVSFSFSEIINGITGSDDTLEHRIVWELRFPRVIIGMIVGIFFTPIGMIMGMFIGAFIGEKLDGKELAPALKSAFGSFVGFVCSTAIKLIYGIATLWLVLKPIVSGGFDFVKNIF